MRAISLWQPWASLIAFGSKAIETRSWPTSYRGPIAIHASKFASGATRKLAGDAPFREALIRGGYQTFNNLPFGFFVAIADLWACVRTEELLGSVGPREIAFGDFGPGRWAWRLRHVRRLGVPVQAAGRQGLWDVPADFARKLEHEASLNDKPVQKITMPPTCPRCGLGGACVCASDLFAQVRR